MNQMQDIRQICGEYPSLVTQQQPLVHLLTNYVTVTDCVNALLAVGARAICSHAPEEAAQVTAGADALVCNLGGTEYYDAMELSFRAAMKGGIPVVIDPVGCGASSHRRRMCLWLIEKYVHEGLRDVDPALCCEAAEETDDDPEPDTQNSAYRMDALRSRPVLAIRGNYAEIQALISGHSDSPGLDDVQQVTAQEETSLKEQMMTFSRRTGAMLIASGEVDLCTDGRNLKEVRCGTPALRRITGAGCLSSAILAAYLAAEQTLDSAVSAIRLVGLAGEAALAAVRESGTGAGHFHMYFLDALSAGDEIWAGR